MRISDWSSDVFSSDLPSVEVEGVPHQQGHQDPQGDQTQDHHRPHRPAHAVVVVPHLGLAPFVPDLRQLSRSPLTEGSPFDEDPIKIPALSRGWRQLTRETGPMTHPPADTAPTAGDVLVVDDEEPLARVVASYLEAADFSVRLAHTATAAVRSEENTS